MGSPYFGLDSIAEHLPEELIAALHAYKAAESPADETQAILAVAEVVRSLAESSQEYDYSGLPLN